MDTVTSADGTVIAYDRSGSGPALVVVAGAFCDRHAFAELGALLSPDFTVHLYDRRGRGDSGDAAAGSVPGQGQGHGAAREPEAAVAHEVEDLGAVLAAAGGSALVFGHSSGAALALEGAMRGLPITALAASEPP